MSRMCRPKWPYLHMYGSHNMRHLDFRGLTSSQLTPRFWGVTNHRALKYLSTQKQIKSDMHAKWLAYIEKFPYKLVHKSRQQNRVANALSRQVDLMRTLSLEIVSLSYG